MLGSSTRRERPRVEVADDCTLSAAHSLRLHWPEYLMDAGESGFYLFSACAVHLVMTPCFASPGIPDERHCSPHVDGFGDWRDHYRDRPFTVGQTVRSALQSRGHIRVLSIRESGVVGCGILCRRAILGRGRWVALASLLLHGAPAHHAVRYAATMPGIYGNTIAFVAELALSFLLMSAILFASNYEVLAPCTHYLAAILVAVYIAFESPLSGMSTNPARTFGPALYGSYWHALWIYFIAPPMGMLGAAEFFLLARERKGPYCAKLHHRNGKRCIFRHSGDPQHSSTSTAIFMKKGLP